MTQPASPLRSAPLVFVLCAAGYAGLSHLFIRPFRVADLVIGLGVAAAVTLALRAR